MRRPIAGQLRVSYTTPQKQFFPPPFCVVWCVCVCGSSFRQLFYVTSAKKKGRRYTNTLIYTDLYSGVQRTASLASRATWYRPAVPDILAVSLTETSVRVVTIYVSVSVTPKQVHPCTLNRSSFRL